MCSNRPLNKNVAASNQSANMIQVYVKCAPTTAVQVPALASLDRSQLTLHTLLTAGMHRHVGVLRELADLAARELVIEQVRGAGGAQGVQA